VNVTVTSGTARPTPPPADQQGGGGLASTDLGGVLLLLLWRARDAFFALKPTAPPEESEAIAQITAQKLKVNCAISTRGRSGISDLMNCPDEILLGPYSLDRLLPLICAVQLSLFTPIAAS
jgi:hypothetical protein